MRLHLNKSNKYGPTSAERRCCPLQDTRCAMNCKIAESSSPRGLRARHAQLKKWQGSESKMTPDRVVIHPHAQALLGESLVVGEAKDNSSLPHRLAADGLSGNRLRR